VSDAANAIAFKIEENVPIDPLNAVYDFKLLPSTDDKRMNAIVTVVQRDIIENYLSLFESENIIVEEVMTSNQALALAAIKRGDKRHYIVVNVHDGKTDISVVIDRIVHYSTTVFSTEEEIVDRVEQVISYWQVHLNDTASHETISVLLSGNELKGDTIYSFLTKHLKVPVSYVDVWTNCFSINDYIPTISKEISYGYGSAIGLALS